MSATSSKTLARTNVFVTSWQHWFGLLWHLTLQKSMQSRVAQTTADAHVLWNARHTMAHDAVATRKGWKPVAVAGEGLSKCGRLAISMQSAMAPKIRMENCSSSWRGAQQMRGT